MEVQQPEQKVELSGAQYRKCLNAGLIALALCTFGMFLYGLHYADSVSAHAHHKWHSTTGVFEAVGSAHGSLLPEYEDATIQFNGTQQAQIQADPSWKVGDTVKMWYTDLGKTYIPADVSKDSPDPYPVPFIPVIVLTFIGFVGGIFLGIGVGFWMYRKKLGQLKAKAATTS